MGNDIRTIEIRNLDTGEAFAALDHSAFCGEIAIDGFAQEIDVQVGGDRELDLADLTQHHHVRARDRAARAQRT